MDSSTPKKRKIRKRIILAWQDRLEARNIYIKTIFLSYCPGIQLVSGVVQVNSLFALTISKIWFLNYRNGTHMKLSWRVNASVCSFGEKLFKYTERNNHLKLLFHDRMFCHARSRENMARRVNLHGRPLDRCTIFGSVPQRNARIMNPKNPDLDLIWCINSECGFFSSLIPD